MREPALTLILGSLVALAACVGPEAPPGDGSTTGPGALPPGSVRVGEDLYQVPLGRDAEGCPMYRLHSPSRMVVQAIFYPADGGGFTMDRGAADCPPAGTAPEQPPPASERGAIE